MFTSTTVNLRTATVFAAVPGGVVLRVTVLEGRAARVIEAYSAIQNEDEVLLKPNTLSRGHVTAKRIVSSRDSIWSRC